MTVLSAGVSQPARAQAAITLAAHKAVYDLVLETANPGSNVTDITGQLTYEFTGSACEGYSLTTRLTTEISDREGKPSVTDIRSQSFERSDFNLYRFNTVQFMNEKQTEATKGTAYRRAQSRGLAIDLEKPRRGTAQVSGNLFFPTQHTVAIIKAAQAGQMRVQADIFDGSDKGEKVYETTTTIGRVLGSEDNRKLPPVAGGELLDPIEAWPVIVSYYDQSPTKDGLPVYEVSFRLYANGVSRKLKLDYGTFALVGELKSIDFLKSTPCPGSRNPTR
jgi:hypothetical protein